MSRRGTLVMMVAMAALAAVIPAPASAATYQQPAFYLPPPPGGDGRIDVLIVPPAHGQVINGNGLLGGSEGGAGELTPFNSYLAAVEAAVADWNRAIDTYGSAALNGLVVPDVYVLGRDSVPGDALRDPEIVINSDENKTFILGVTLSTNPCLVNNSKFFVTSFTYADMYSVSSHEYAHCLGLGHATGPGGDQVIAHDVMNGSYADTVGSTPRTHLHCPSNLNIKGLESLWVARSTDPVTIDSAQYARIAC